MVLYDIEKGILELKTPSLYAQIPQNKQRRSGGGRKKKFAMTQL